MEESNGKAAKRTSEPDLKRFMDQRVVVRLTENRKVAGVLMGVDSFMNLVLHHATEECWDGSSKPLGKGDAPCLIRGNMVVNLEPAPSK